MQSILSQALLYLAIGIAMLEVALLLIDAFVEGSSRFRLVCSPRGLSGPTREVKLLD